jgi:hypothetical protein
VRDRDLGVLRERLEAAEHELEDLRDPGCAHAARVAPASRLGACRGLPARPRRTGERRLLPSG